MTCVAVHEGQNCKSHQFILIITNGIHYVGLEYQEDLKLRAVNDATARKDQQHLEVRTTTNRNYKYFQKTYFLQEMIKRREAMHWLVLIFNLTCIFIVHNIFSPGCQVIIQKLSGCDWLQCTQCKMEICVSFLFLINF